MCLDLIKYLERVGLRERQADKLLLARLHASGEAHLAFRCSDVGELLGVTGRTVGMQLRRAHELGDLTYIPGRGRRRSVVTWAHQSPEYCAMIRNQRDLFEDDLRVEGPGVEVSEREWREGEKMSRIAGALKKKRGGPRSTTNYGPPTPPPSSTRERAKDDPPSVLPSAQRSGGSAPHPGGTDATEAGSAPAVLDREPESFAPGELRSPLRRRRGQRLKANTLERLSNRRVRLEPAGLPPEDDPLWRQAEHVRDLFVREHGGECEPAPVQSWATRPHTYRTVSGAAADGEAVLIAAWVHESSGFRWGRLLARDPLRYGLRGTFLHVMASGFGVPAESRLPVRLAELVAEAAETGSAPAQTEPRTADGAKAISARAPLVAADPPGLGEAREIDGLEHVYTPSGWEPVGPPLRRTADGWESWTPGLGWEPSMFPPSPELREQWGL